jgi:hypothetical protein
MLQAACRGIVPKDHTGPDLFFPERGETKLAHRAQELCMTCPVFAACNEYQERMKSQYGIWAARRVSPG